MQGTQKVWVQYLGWEDSLEEEIATHSSILAWKTPMDRGARRSTVHGIAKSWTWLGDSAHALTLSKASFYLKSQLLVETYFCSPSCYFVKNL